MVAEEVYHAKDPVNDGLKAGLTFAGIGFVVAALQNSLQTHGVGASGVLTKAGGSIAHFALIGGIFAVTRATTANIRKSDDWVNSAAAGCAAGLAAGIRAHSWPMSIGACVGIGTLMGTYEFTGQLKGVLHGKSEEEKRTWRRKFARNPQLLEDDEQ